MLGLAAVVGAGVGFGHATPFPGWAALVPVLALVFGYPALYVVFGVLAAALIIVRHRSNITRLLNGTENRISAGHL